MHQTIAAEHHDIGRHAPGDRTSFYTLTTTGVVYTQCWLYIPAGITSGARTLSALCPLPYLSAVALFVRRCPICPPLPYLSAVGGFVRRWQISHQKPALLQNLQQNTG